MSKGFGQGPQRWHGKFRECGYRLTMPRQLILDVLSKTSKHLSVEEIYLAVHETYPAIGLTTVYRTLELLAGMGLVLRFDFGDGRARYEFCGRTRAKKHHHLLCINCGRIIDYREFVDDEKELLNRTEKNLSERYNFKITHHLIQFYGLCEKCQK